jgi:hypothetical protein
MASYSMGIALTAWETCMTKISLAILCLVMKNRQANEPPSQSNLLNCNVAETWMLLRPCIQALRIAEILLCMGDAGHRCAAGALFKSPLGMCNEPVQHKIDICLIFARNAVDCAFVGRKLLHCEGKLLTQEWTEGYPHLQSRF